MAHVNRSRTARPPKPGAGATGAIGTSAAGQNYLNIAEVARRLNVSTKTVVRRINSGDLPVHRFGPRTVRISESDLKAFAALRRIT
jgi:excisionase family DNA binding protein